MESNGIMRARSCFRLGTLPVFPSVYPQIGPITRTNKGISERTEIFGGNGGLRGRN